jgi:hypothetical protein
MASESVFAFKNLGKKLQDRTITVLKDTLEQTNSGHYFSFFPARFYMLLLLSG